LLFLLPVLLSVPNCKIAGPAPNPELGNGKSQDWYQIQSRQLQIAGPAPNPEAAELQIAGPGPDLKAAEHQTIKLPNCKDAAPAVGRLVRLLSCVPRYVHWSSDKGVASIGHLASIGLEQ